MVAEVVVGQVGPLVNQLPNGVSAMLPTLTRVHSWGKSSTRAVVAERVVLVETLAWAAAWVEAWAAENSGFPVAVGCNMGIFWKSKVQI
jgi:hypothetical protein